MICTIIFYGNASIYGYSYEAPYVITPIHNVVNVRSKPQTPKETQCVSVQT
jgi:hypothetical protein